jgi:F-type H+-transporting ATPase subunit gamma
MTGRDLLHRMKSIRQTVKISSAQKLLAASQIGKARKQLEETLPYHKNVSRAFAAAILHAPKHGSRYIESGRAHANRHGLLLLSASRGLAGGYNGNIVHFAEKYLEGTPADYILALGKARAHFMKSGFPVDAAYDRPLDHPTVFLARELAEKVTGMLESGSVGSFDVIYTAYRSPVKLEVVQKRLFPLAPELFVGELGRGCGGSGLIFEPSPERVIASMALKYLKGYLYGCLAHAWICELTSRVMAMESAIRNGNEMLEELALAYNRGRQAAITQEITEIVAGAAAMRQ